MDCHLVTTSHYDKLVKISDFFKEEDLPTNLNANSYAYQFKLDSYSLIVPCSIIYDAYFACQKPLINATLEGNLNSLYYEFEYIKESSINITLNRQISKYLVPFICQILIDKNVLNKFVYIYAQKLMNNNIFNKDHIKCFFPFYGTFDLYCITQSFYSELGELCLAVELSKNSFLQYYNIHNINIKVKQKKEFTDILYLHKINTFLYYYSNFLKVLNEIDNKNVMLKKTSIEFQLSHHFFPTENFIDIHWISYQYKNIYLCLIFIADEKMKKNLICLKLLNKMSFDIINDIRKVYHKREKKPIEKLLLYLNDIYKIKQLRLSHYYMSKYAIDILIKNIINFCEEDIKD